MGGYHSGYAVNDNFISAKNMHGLLGYTCDPAVVSATNTPTAATIILGKIPVPYTITVANILFVLTTSGTGATAISNAQVGLYSSAGVLLGSSAAADLAAGGAQAIDEASLGVKTVTVVAETGQSLTVAGGPTAFVWAAIHIGVQASTPAVVRAGPSSSAATPNAGLAAASSRCGTITGHATNNLTTIGAFTPSSISQVSQLLWFGLS